MAPDTPDPTEDGTRFQRSDGNGKARAGVCSAIPYCLWLYLAEAGHLGGTDLKGLIISDEIGGQPIADVQVSASGANDATSNSLGIFTLQFPQKSAGETVRLVVGRKGYEVVNDLQLEIRLPDNAETGLIAILLCKDGDYEEMARRFYRVMCIREIEKTCKKRLRES